VRSSARIPKQIPILLIAATVWGGANFFCPSCESPFQLKSQSKPLGSRIVDAAYSELHPNNAHVRDKIRQQLQVLRDLGLLEFLGSGSYRLR